MPYKDAGKRKEVNRLAMERSRKGTPGAHKEEGYTGENTKIMGGVHNEHPIMKYLIPGEDREKMEKIVQSLENHKQLGNVRFGCGASSLSMEFVGEMLEVTGK